MFILPALQVTTAAWKLCKICYFLLIHSFLCFFCSYINSATLCLHLLFHLSFVLFLFHMSFLMSFAFQSSINCFPHSPPPAPSFPSNLFFSVCASVLSSFLLFPTYHLF